ncbi:MAG: hypothetical protein ACYC5O_18950, partial [Anaerolineae bacterium]
ALRQVYGSAMANGPFSIIIGHSGGMIGLADRAKLRPLVAARSGDLFLLASEESAIRAVAPEPDSIWSPKAGFPAEGVLRAPDEPAVAAEERQWSPGERQWSSGERQWSPGVAGA